MKKQYLIIAISTLAFTCKDKSGDLINPQQLTTLACTLSKTVSGSQTILYSYNPQGLLVKIDYTNSTYSLNSTITFEYNSSGKLSLIRYDGGYESTFEYQGDGSVIESRTGPLGTSKGKYEYNADGRLTRETDMFTPGRYWRYEYSSNGNPSKMFYSNPPFGPEFLYEEYLEYDDKKYPLGQAWVNFTIFIARNPPELSVEYAPERGSFQHNCIRFKRYTGPNVLQQEYVSTFEYNASGYPTKANGGSLEYVCK